MDDFTTELMDFVEFEMLGDQLESIAIADQAEALARDTTDPDVARISRDSAVFMRRLAAEVAEGIKEAKAVEDD